MVRKRAQLRIQYLEFSGNEHAGGPNQLEVLSLHLSTAEVGVHQAYGNVEGLVEQFKVLLHLNKPVDENGAHRSIDVGLFWHVVRNGK